MGKARKTSRLGWDMDHAWLLRDGTWLLEGEWRAVGSEGIEVRGRMEIAGTGARLSLGAGPRREFGLESGRTNGKPFAVSVRSGDLELRGSAAPLGGRIWLAAASGGWNLSENAVQRADGSVDIEGLLSLSGEPREAWRWTARPEELDETWTIGGELVAEVRGAARSGAPLEQCGLLVGRSADRVITGSIPMTNVDASEDHYSMDPREQFAAIKRLRGSGEEVVGHWHSHPFSPARQSDEDLKLAADESAVYGLVSLMEEEAPFRLFRVQGGASFPVRVQVD